MTIVTNPNEVLWTQRYRPKRVEDTILPASTKAIFQKMVDDNNVQNLLLTGKPGTGKTTVAIAMLEEIGADYIVINGSLKNGIDVLRVEIANFASAISFSGGRKFVIIDEADYLNPNSVQPALRNFIEEFSSNCGFIFTCNFKNRIISPLRSRFSEIDFTIPKEETQQLALQFFKRVQAILGEERVEFDKAAVVKVIQKHFPDFRRILGELQSYAATGRIDDGITADIKGESIDELFVLMKAKKYTEMRKWVAVNSDSDASELFRAIYDAMVTKIELKSQPGAIVVLGEYQYKHSFVADPEINLMAMCVELMMECSFV
jgi:DNA polymerase III delta prime subunit